MMILPATRSLLGREGRCDRLDRAGRRGLRRLGLQWLSLSGCQPTITPPRGPEPKGNGSAGAAAPICRFLSKINQYLMSDKKIKQ